ncbi:MAG: acetylornithine deacetylase [Phycisphaerales bacterium]
MDCVIDHLHRLVAANTTNPPRLISSDEGAVRYCAEVLEQCGFATRIIDLGDGCLNLIATRGAPKTIVNCHLDTVPACEGWTGDPFSLRIEGNDAVGLGACDIKGAAAALLSAAQRTRGDAMIFFSTDEEAGSSRCVRTFLAEQSPDIDAAVVCEPTQCQAVTAHRGLLSVEAVFTGTSGHASAASTDSAIHRAVKWSAAALDWRERDHPASRLSIGVIEGGVKPNMTASSARVRFGLRPEVGASAESHFVELKNLANGADVAWTERFHGPALTPSHAAAALAHRLGAPIGDPVDFWTEAALFAAAGIPSVVFGPGSIAQAHAPNERVPVAQLELAATCYARLFEGGLA